MERGSKKKFSRVKKESNSGDFTESSGRNSRTRLAQKAPTIAARSYGLSCLSLWYSQLSPFESGLFWGILVSLTATISATIGASLTLINSVSNAIGTLVSEANTKETEIFPDSQLNIAPQEVQNSPHYAERLPAGSEVPTAPLSKLNLEQADNWSAYREKQTLSVKNLAVLQSTPIALENTTNQPELAMDLLFYLNERNLYNVYLSRSLSLELKETEIIFSSGNFQAAKNLQNILGIGRLKPSTTEDSNSDIIIRLGGDARLFSQEDSFIRD